MNNRFVFSLSSCLFLLSFCVLFAAAKTANAAGFYIQEQSVSGLGASYAGIAAMPRDASTIYYNPAGMTHLEGTQINIGGHMLYGNSEMTNTGSTLFGAPLTSNDGGNPVGLKGVPNLYISHQFFDRVWFGLGVSFPFGLGSKFNSDWFGRFDSTKSELETIDIQPSMAVQINDWLSFGLGLNYQFADAELVSAVTDGVQGLSILEGNDDGSAGYTAGILIRPWETTTIGLNYKSEISHEIDGRIIVDGTLGSDFNVGGTADLNLPDIASMAIAHQIGDSWTLLAQANWFGWNNFQSITAISDAGTTVSDVIQNYQTTWSFAVGAEYQATEKLALRAGYQYDETPTTDLYRTSRTPDGDRDWYSVGATYNIMDSLSVDLAATYIDIENEDISVSRNSGLAAVNMDVDADVSIVSLGLNLKF